MQQVFSLIQSAIWFGTVILFGAMGETRVAMGDLISTKLGQGCPKIGLAFIEGLDLFRVMGVDCFFHGDGAGHSGFGAQKGRRRT